ncbi:MAG TPA: hypothetical protein VN831_11680 [Bradyrhizobium sp.]|nr:hypothetical protein [Bradyrhizobium sp.]
MADYRQFDSIVLTVVFLTLVESMTDDTPQRFTIDQVDQSLPLDQWKPRLADYGRRRHLSYTLDFDTRVHTLEDPGMGWDEAARAMHLKNQELTRQRLGAEFGTDALDAKVQNFIDIGSKPFSVLAYHNRLFDEVRRAFVIGAYYPALVGACALGERILNHLILDLRAQYSHTPEYKKVFRKDSFDDWRIVIDALEAWEMLLPKAVSEFRALMTLRHRSIHFNVSTYSTLREDALTAILHMREIIDQQFTAFGLRPWFILGTKGHIFIKREWEKNPFVKAYYLPTCPFVGPYFAISFTHGLRFHDHNDYGDGAWTDEGFAQVFNDRTFERMPLTD